RVGERSQEREVLCPGCAKACKLQARMINHQSLSVRANDLAVEDICDEGLSWWHHLDLNKNNIPLLHTTKEDELFVPVSLEDIEHDLSVPRKWQVALPGDLSQDEATF